MRTIGGAGQIGTRDRVCHLIDESCDYNITPMLIECVPNVSEGRRPAVIAELTKIVQVPGTRLLDHSSDPSHNRSVFTIVGDIASLQTAVLSLYARAIANIDLRQHEGEHPRIGVIDVVPFIPLSGASMSDCVELAHTVGALVSAEHGIPIFLYEEAAAASYRRPLESIRRGGLNALAARMRSGEWKPDYGPARPHPTAGVSVVGARKLLIAFNVNLETREIDIARTIAATIRQSSGGLPHVKAIGVRLAEEGVVQVSMNLTDFEHTSLLTVFEAVSREAARHGVRVAESEIIGLVPEAALSASTARLLRVRGFSPDRILEHRIRDVS